MQPDPNCPTCGESLAEPVSVVLPMQSDNINYRESAVISQPSRLERWTELPPAVAAATRLEHAIHRRQTRCRDGIDQPGPSDRFVGRPLPLGACPSCGRDNSTLTLRYQHPALAWVELGCGCTIHGSAGIDAICRRLSDAA